MLDIQSEPQDKQWSEQQRSNGHTSRLVSWTVHPKRSGLMISASHCPCASVSYAGALLIEVIGTVIESPGSR